MNARALTFTVGCLLVVAGVLVYLEWWRQGELEYLSDRVASLEEHRRQRATRQPRKPAAEGTKE